MLDDLERSLNFDYHSGGVVMVHPPHSMGWRLLPFAVSAQVGYPALVETDGQRVHIPKGDALFVPQNMRHHVCLVGETKGVSRFSHFKFLIFGSIDVLTLFKVPFHLSGRFAARLGTLNAKLADVSNHSTLSLRERIARKTLGFQLLENLVAASADSPANATSFDALRRLMPVLTAIRGRISGRIRLAELARTMHLSESRFHAVFKEMTGVAPQFYIQRLRIQSAQQLLIETELSIKEIAGRVGHADVFHFSRLFKQRCGVSPSLYREQARRTFLGRQG